MLSLIGAIHKHFSTHISNGEYYRENLGQASNLWYQTETWLALGGWQLARTELARRGYHGIVADIEHAV